VLSPAKKLAFEKTEKQKITNDIRSEKEGIKADAKEIKIEKRYYKL
jgi:hypothetical protein